MHTTVEYLWHLLCAATHAENVVSVRALVHVAVVRCQSTFY